MCCLFAAWCSAWKASSFGLGHSLLYTLYIYTSAQTIMTMVQALVQHTPGKSRGSALRTLKCSVFSSTIITSPREGPLS